MFTQTFTRMYGNSYIYREDTTLEELEDLYSEKVEQALLELQTIKHSDAYASFSKAVKQEIQKEEEKLYFAMSFHYDFYEVGNNILESVPELEELVFLIYTDLYELCKAMDIKEQGEHLCDYEEEEQCNEHLCECNEHEEGEHEEEQAEDVFASW